MSYFISPIPFEESSTCSDSKCNLAFSEKCKCYPNFQIDALKNLPLKLQKERLNSDQICAHQQGDFLIPCGKECCDEGCPGECPDVKPRRPEAYSRGVSLFKNVNYDTFEGIKRKEEKYIKSYISEFIWFLLVISILIIVNFII